MRHLSSQLLLFVVLLLALPAAPFAAHIHDVPDNPKDICPLLIGNTVPAVNLQTIDGKTVRLSEEVKKKPTILIFYRGGWCPYCNLQLGELAQIETDLLKLGYQIIAISLDKPEYVEQTKKKHETGYMMLSDSDATAAKAFGIAWRLETAAYDQYRSLGFDIEQASGQQHHILPVPAAFVVNKEGMITFSYVHPDFRIRVSADVLLAAAKAGLRQ